MARPSQRPPPSSYRRGGEGRHHRRVSSTADLLDNNGDGVSQVRTSRDRSETGRSRDSSRARQRSSSRTPRHHSRHHGSSASETTSKTSSQTLSIDSLAQLNALNEKQNWSQREKTHRTARDVAEDQADAEQRARREARRQRRRERDSQDHTHRKDDRRRKVSGPVLEKGISRERRPHIRGGGRGPGVDDGASDESQPWWKRRRKLIIAGVVLILVIIIIAVAVGVSQSNKNNSSKIYDTDTSSEPKPSNNNLNGISPSSIPASAKGTYLDPFTWYDTNDFNVTYTDVTIGGLPIMGLNLTWDDNTRANSEVPALNEAWDYGTTPIRGVNLGGWLSIEPFITPSLFDSYSSSQNVIDEWTLSEALGATNAASTIEQHYSGFVSEQDLADIQAAGFDHVRIPFSYWAVTTYDGDPYVPKISWRYLLRGLEWARKHGLRINLDLHGAPGSQNGWNHSGRQGLIGWLNGTDGQLNADRTLDIHTQLTTFFAQPRYKNLITIYGLVNEPRMVAIDTNSVLNWTQSAIDVVRGSGMPSSVIIAIGDGFLGLANWQGKLTGNANLLLDAHQYVIFNTAQIALDHKAKVDFACQGWKQQSQQSMSTATGFGSFLCGEWSQADTDCVTYLNDVGVGSRWEGTLNTGNASTSVLDPTCPTQNDPQCTCDPANGDPSSYSAEYKTWLRMFAEAQMHSYEFGWGWFYWTWKTESAVQWSYQLGMQAGIAPTNVRQREFDCSQSVPDYAGAGLSETY